MAEPQLTEAELTAENFENAVKTAITSAAMVGHPLDQFEIAKAAGKIFGGFIDELKRRGMLVFKAPK